MRPLDRRITLQQRTTTRDPATGAQQVGWSTLASLWASVEEFSNVGASEEFARKGIQVHGTLTRIRTRWLAGVDTAMRVQLDNGALLQITGLAMKGRRQWLELSCNQWSHE